MNVIPERIIFVSRGITVLFMWRARYSYQILTKLKIFSTDFRNILRYQILWKSVQLAADLFHADGRTDRQTDMMKLRVAFRNFANAPKHSRCLPQLIADLPAETQTGDLPNASTRKPFKRDIQQLISTAFPANPACRLLPYCIKGIWYKKHDDDETSVPLGYHHAVTSVLHANTAYKCIINKQNNVQGLKYFNQPCVKMLRKGYMQRLRGRH